jgi:hypothetical protein
VIFWDRGKVGGPGGIKRAAVSAGLATVLFVVIGLAIRPFIGGPDFKLISLVIPAVYFAIFFAGGLLLELSHRGPTINRD